MPTDGPTKLPASALDSDLCLTARAAERDGGVDRAGSGSPDLDPVVSTADEQPCPWGARETQGDVIGGFQDVVPISRGGKGCQPRDDHSASDSILIEAEGGSTIAVGIGEERSQFGGGLGRLIQDDVIPDLLGLRSAACAEDAQGYVAGFVLYDRAPVE